MQGRSFGLVAVAMSMVMAVGPAGAASVVGVAVSNGRMAVDRAAVAGNATLKEGARVESTEGAARIQWQAGGRATLAAGSVAQVYGDRLVLEAGQSSSGMPVTAKGLTIRGGQAQVVVREKAVQVAALSGAVEVRDGSGLMLARVTPGRALELTPGAGAAGESAVAGLLRSEKGRLVVRDRMTDVETEVRGAGLAEQVGKNVEIRGTLRAAVLEVARVSRFEEEAGQSGGSKPDTGTGSQPKPTGTGTSGGGMSNGTKIAIAVVAIGGAAGAGLAFAGKGSSSSNVSR